MYIRATQTLYLVRNILSHECRVIKSKAVANSQRGGQDRPIFKRALLGRHSGCLLLAHAAMLINPDAIARRLEWLSSREPV
jgi:hypothetical protein